jgi:acetyl esterase/lipase
MPSILNDPTPAMNAPHAFTQKTYGGPTARGLRRCLKITCPILHAAFLGVAFFLSALSSKAGTLVQSATPPDAKGYTYKSIDGVDLLLDVFTPPQLDTSKPVPVLIFFHGGGWDHGDKQGAESYCRYFTQRGLVTVSANYRFIDPLINKNRLPLGDAKSICVQDGKSAIRWVRSHASELGIDPNRVILGGDSAGTEIAVVSAMSKDFNDPKDDPAIPTSATALLLYNPAFTPPHNEDPKLEPFMYASASMPPLILFSGTKDGWRGPSTKFLSDCKAAGVKGEMWVAPDQLHGFSGHPNWLQATCIKADAFLISLGLLSGTPPAPPDDVKLLTPEEYAATAPSPTPSPTPASTAPSP